MLLPGVSGSFPSSLATSSSSQIHKNKPTSTAPPAACLAGLQMLAPHQHLHLIKNTTSHGPTCSLSGRASIRSPAASGMASSRALAAPACSTRCAARPKLECQAQRVPHAHEPTMRALGSGGEVVLWARPSRPGSPWCCFCALLLHLRPTSTGSANDATSRAKRHWTQATRARWRPLMAAR